MRHPLLHALALLALPLAPLTPCRGQAPVPASPAHEALALRDAVVRHDWAHARTILAARRAEADAAAAQEGRYVFAYIVFRTPDPAMEPHLDAWVAAQPGSAYARLARADYRLGRAWASRGTGYASKTSRSQVSGMARWAALARVDADTAIALDSTDVAAYVDQLEVARAISDQDLASRTMRAAMTTVPASLLLHLTYMESLRPRWGGSDAEMREYAGHVQRFAIVNPRLGVLRGFAAYDRAVGYNEDGKKESALASITEALSYGDLASFRLFRAKLLLDLDQPERALVDLNRAILLRPEDARQLGFRGLVYAMLGYQHQGAGPSPGLFRRGNADMRAALALDPYDSEVVWTRDYFARFSP